jgi:hypothetical protein
VEARGLEREMEEVEKGRGGRVGAVEEGMGMDTVRQEEEDQVVVAARVALVGEGGRLDSANSSLDRDRARIMHVQLLESVFYRKVSSDTLNRWELLFMRPFVRVHALAHAILRTTSHPDNKMGHATVSQLCAYASTTGN